MLKNIGKVATHRYTDFSANRDSMRMSRIENAFFHKINLGQ